MTEGQKKKTRRSRNELGQAGLHDAFAICPFQVSAKAVDGTESDAGIIMMMRRRLKAE